MKKHAFLIFFITVLAGCSTNDPYYKGPINKWFDKNLHDPESYESVSFEILQEDQISKYLPKISSQYSNLQNVHQRKIDLLPKLVREFKGDVKEGKLEGILDLRGEMSSLDTLGLFGVFKMKMLHDSLDNEVNNLINESGGVSELDQSTKAIIAQYEGAKKRFASEQKQLLDEFSKLELSFENIDRFVNEGLIIYHKYRANNKMGAKVLNEMVFVLNKSKSKVIATQKL